MSDQVPEDLAQILAPYRSVDFLETSFGKKLLFIPGEPGKFSRLLPWEALNQILRQHRLESPRLRLFLNGKQVAAESYLRVTQSQRRRQVRVPRLLSREFTAKLREGATLIIDAIDELYEPLTALAESLERTFSEHIQVNAYAGWQTSPGFDLHWDDHDVLILQLYGRKRWAVHGPSRPYPLARDAVRNTEKPAEPVWEDVLSDGDLLYIPRGWWHCALPLAEPTLHLTVGIHNRTAIDLLGWLQDEMRSSELFRRDLPRFASAEEKANHMYRLRAELIARWNDNLVDEYFAARNGLVQPRPNLGLPWTAQPLILPDGDDFQVRWAVPRKLVLADSAHEGSFSFHAAGRAWQFASRARPAIELLAGGKVYQFAQLSLDLSGTLDPEALRGLVADLVREGLLVLV